MDAKQRMLALAALGLSTLAGCPTTQSRTYDQGGGSSATALLKIANGNLSGLTPDEIQILADRIDQRKPALNIALTDDDAAAISEFLVVNHLDTVASVTAAIDNPNGLVVPASLETMIKNLSSAN